MAEAKDKSIFETLNPINVNENIEVKNGFKYLSWSWAWGRVKKIYPEASFKIIKNDMGWIYHTDGRTAWVEVEVTINGLTHSEILPVMDFRNNSIPLDKITSFDANKAVHRCLVKCLALHGLGLYIYAGEDLPEEATEPKQEEPKQEEPKQEKKTSSKRKAAETPKQPIMEAPEDSCCICGKIVSDYLWTNPNGSGEQRLYKAETIKQKAIEKYGSPICYECMAKKAMADRKKGGQA